MRDVLRLVDVVSLFKTVTVTAIRLLRTEDWQADNLFKRAVRLGCLLIRQWTGDRHSELPSRVAQ